MITFLNTILYAWHNYLQQYYWWHFVNNAWLTLFRFVCIVSLRQQQMPPHVIILVVVEISDVQLGVIIVVVHVVDIVVVVVVVFIIRPLRRRPQHLVFLLQTPPGVSEPRGHLGQGHLRDDRQHDLLTLGGVGVLDVLVEPRLQRRRRLAGGVLPSNVQTTVTGCQEINRSFRTW